MKTRPVLWRRSLLIGAGLVVVMAVIGGLGFLIQCAPAGRTPSATAALQGELVRVADGAAAESPSHGPRVRAGGRSAGFAHDELGAAIAASNIAPRITSSAGPAVYEPTLAEQCFGDSAVVLAQLRTSLPRPDSPSRDALVPRALYYRVLAGDPSGEQVVVSLLAETPQARSLGGLSRVDMTLRWSNDDWRLRVPLPRPSLHHDTDGYTLLGRLS